jgi:hypothetical protein
MVYNAVSLFTQIFYDLNHATISNSNLQLKFILKHSV